MNEEEFTVEEMPKDVEETLNKIYKERNLKMSKNEIEKEIYKLLDNVNVDKEKQKELFLFVKDTCIRVNEFKRYLQICNLYDVFNNAFTSFIVVNNINNVYQKELKKVHEANNKWNYLFAIHQCEILKNYKNIIVPTFVDLENLLCKIEKSLHKNNNNNTEVFKQLMFVLMYITDISSIIDTMEEYFSTKNLTKTFDYIQETLNMLNARTNIMLDICERMCNNDVIVVVLNKLKY